MQSVLQFFQDMSPLRKLVLLLVLAVIVVGLFFVQYQQIASKSAPQPAPTPIMAQSGNIVVTIPYAESSLPPDFMVRGKARVFEGVVSLRVTSTLLGNVYFSGQTMTNAPEMGAFGEFAVPVHLNTKDNTLRPNDKLTLEVFQVSAKDGQEIDKVTIPLFFSPNLP